MVKKKGKKEKEIIENVCTLFGLKPKVTKGEDIQTSGCGLLEPHVHANGNGLPNLGQISSLGHQNLPAVSLSNRTFSL